MVLTKGGVAVLTVSFCQRRLKNDFPDIPWPNLPARSWQESSFTC